MLHVGLLYIHITSRLYKDSTRMASPDLPDSLLGGVVPPVSRGDLGSEVYRDRNPWSFFDKNRYFPDDRHEG